MTPTTIRELIASMTLEEKAALCTGDTPWQTFGVPRLGLDPITLTDGPHGVRRTLDITSMVGGSHPATCFPVAAALSASWDTELIYEMGQALGEECLALGVDILLGPGINMKRSPLCGRNFEYFSEDPLLAGELAASLINGIQSKGVGTALKHFAVNNQETRRFTIDVSVDERTLHEIYLTAFEIAVKKANPWSIMCAYNSVNGEFCAENTPLLTGVLRDQWGYEGFVMSDWGAVHDRVAALSAGLELEMPGPSPHRVQDVIRAVKNGTLDAAVLDRAVERLLKVILRAHQTPKGGSIDIDAHHALARRIAAECMVLLKNDGDLLPLKGDETLAVIGHSAQTPVYQGGGSSHINSTRVESPLEHLRQRAEVQYAAGDGTSVQVDHALINDAVSVARGADVALLFIALPASVESEGYDRADLQLTPQQIALIHAVSTANPRCVVILNNGSAIDMRGWIKSVPAVLEAWLPGQAGAGAIIDVLYGTVNPSGKLGETFPLSIKDTPAYLNFPGERDSVRYGEGIYIGYRAYEMQERPVLFPFGYGLSYTQFSYSNISVSSSHFTLEDGVQVSFDVTNSGTRTGKEIVQVYVADVTASLHRPHKELKAFAKVALNAGETKRLTLTLDARAFSYYHPVFQRWVAEAGEFELNVGASSQDIRLKQRVTLTEGTPLPSILNIHSTMGDWLDDPRGAEKVRPLAEMMFGNADGDALGVDMMTFFKDLPLTVMFGFQGALGGASPQEIVEGMLADL